MSEVKEEVKNKGGAPRKEIDFKLFEELCKIQCTKMEICNILGIHDDTLETRLKENYGEGFSAIYKIFADHGKMSLRRAQMRVALNGNVGMLIWLGKQYLGQTEKMEVVSQEFINQEIEIIASPNGNKAEVENRVKQFIK